MPNLYALLIYKSQDAVLIYKPQDAVLKFSTKLVERENSRLEVNDKKSLFIQIKLSTLNTNCMVIFKSQSKHTGYRIILTGPKHPVFIPRPTIPNIINQQTYNLSLEGGLWFCGGVGLWSGFLCLCGVFLGD